MLNKRKKKLTIVIIILMIITSLVILNVIIKKETLYKNRVNIQNEVENLADNELDNIEDYEEDYEIEEEPLIEQENELQEENVNEIENTANLNENTSKISIKDMHKAIQEVADAFYNRGKYVQYSGPRKSYYFSPEQATSQHTIYTVCSCFTFNIYYQAFGIKIPNINQTLTEYGKKYYDPKNENSDVIEFFQSIKDENGNRTYLDNKGNLREDIDFSTKEGRMNYGKELLKMLEVGDVISEMGEKSSGRRTCCINL